MLTLPQVAHADEPAFLRTCQHASPSATPDIRARCAKMLAQAVRAGRIKPRQMRTALESGDVGMARLKLRHAPQLPVPSLPDGCFQAVIDESVPVAEPTMMDAVKGMVTWLSGTGDLTSAQCQAIATRPTRTTALTVLNEAWSKHCQRLLAPIHARAADYLKHWNVAVPSSPALLIPTGLLALLDADIAATTPAEDEILLGQVYMDPFSAFSLPDWRIETDSQWAVSVAFDELSHTLGRSLLVGPQELLYLHWELEVMMDASLAAEWEGDTPHVQPEHLEALNQEFGLEPADLNGESFNNLLRYLRWQGTRGDSNGEKRTLADVRDWCRSHTDSLLHELVDSLVGLIDLAKSEGVSDHSTVATVLDDSGYAGYFAIHAEAGMDRYAQGIEESCYSNSTESGFAVCTPSGADPHKELDGWVRACAIAFLAVTVCEHAAQKLAQV